MVIALSFGLQFVMDLLQEAKLASAIASCRVCKKIGGNLVFVVTRRDILKIGWRRLVVIDQRETGECLSCNVR